MNGPEGNRQQSTGEYTAYWLGATSAAQEMEKKRLLEQNTSEGRARWGVGYGEYLDFIVSFFAAEGRPFVPHHIAEIGIGPDATLVIEELKRFGSSIESLDIYEIDQERLDGARQTIEERFKEQPELLAKISYICGPAQNTLRAITGDKGKEKSKKYDLINAQLIFEHLEQTPTNPSRQNLQAAIADSLSESGIYIIGDLAVGEGHWDARLKEVKTPSRWRRRARSEFLARQQEAKERVAQINAAILGLRRGGWGPNKPDFGQPSEISDMVTTYSRGLLEEVPALRREWPLRDLRSEEDEVSIMQQMLLQTTPDDEDRPARKLARVLMDAIKQNNPLIDIGYPTMVRRAFMRRTS